MLDMIKDFFLITFMLMVMFWCVFHDFQERFGFLFKRKQTPAAPPKAKPKFQGSAQVWLK